MEPIAGAGLAAAAGSEAVKTTSRLVSRVLGPSADEVGDWLARLVRRRLTTIDKIAEAAERKGATEKDGEVNPRLAHKVLEEGSYFDGELSAEYFGGMLAGSKTPDGRDDSAVAWASMVSTMSSTQIRLHFILYREWARLLQGRVDINVGVAEGREQCKAYVDLNEVLRALAEPSDGVNEMLARLEHGVIGVYRLGLISAYGWGGRTNSGQFSNSPYDLTFTASPTGAGFELYGWAQGVGHLSAARFPEIAIPFDPVSPVPSLSSMVAPTIREVSETTEHDADATTN